MGGLPCYKQVIDQRNGVVQVMDCMKATMNVGLSAGIQPTYQESEAFAKAAENLAAVSTSIEKRIAGEAGLGGSRSQLHPLKPGHDGGAT